MNLIQIKKFAIFFSLVASPIVAAPFAENGNGTVTDLATGLVWQKCSWGQTGSDCSGSSVSFVTWSVALNNCNGLSLSSRTWRLPNIAELRSILDLTKTSGALIDSNVFPATSSTSYYWSSTTGTLMGYATAKAVFFGSTIGGTEFDDLKTYQSGYVRCVSGP